MKRLPKLFIVLMVVFCSLIFSTTVMAEALSFDITDMAELKKVGMYLKKIRKKSTQDAVVFVITIKNSNSVPHLYSVTVAIPGAGGSEGFIPAKGNKKLAPQAEGTTSIGIIYSEFPKVGYMIKIEAVEAR